MVKFIILSAISHRPTWDFTFWVCQPSPMLYSKLFLHFLLLLHILYWFFIVRLIDFIVPNSCKKPWFSLKCSKHISQRKVSNNKVSHLVRFILGFGTENSVTLSEVSHLLSVPQWGFHYCKMIEENSGPAKSVPLSEVSHLASVPLREVLLYMFSNRGDCFTQNNNKRIHILYNKFGTHACSMF